MDSLEELQNDCLGFLAERLEVIVLLPYPHVLNALRQTGQLAQREQPERHGYQRQASESVILYIPLRWLHNKRPGPRRQ
jgi:hypothetical protein